MCTRREVTLLSLLFEEILHRVYTTHIACLILLCIMVLPTLVRGGWLQPSLALFLSLPGINTGFFRRGSGGMLFQENLEIYKLEDCFWWLLRPHTFKKLIYHTLQQVHVLVKYMYLAIFWGGRGNPRVPLPPRINPWLHKQV